jgi:Holliday junction resolvase
LTWDKGKWELVKKLKKKPEARFVMPLSSSGYEAPDVFLNFEGMKYVIEAKTSHAKAIYISHEQIEGLENCAKYMDAIPVIAVKFIGTRKGWKYFYPHKLRQTGKNRVVTLEEYETVGSMF